MSYGHSGGLSLKKMLLSQIIFHKKHEDYFGNTGYQKERTFEYKNPKIEPNIQTNGNKLTDFYILASLAGLRL